MKLKTNSLSLEVLLYYTIYKQRNILDVQYTKNILNTSSKYLMTNKNNK